MALALPIVRASGMDVLAHGRSDHERTSYFLVRAFKAHAHLQAQQQAFYSSNGCKLGPRENLVSCVAHYTNTLLWLSEDAVEDLRRSSAS
jgi:hypothetical protein